MVPKQVENMIIIKRENEPQQPTKILIFLLSAEPAMSK